MTGFQIKDRIDTIIYFIYNCTSSFLFCFSFKLKKRIRRNRIFRNKHLLQRCFIMGCGPSLKNIKDEHLSFLEKEIIFGVNGLFLTPSLQNLRPSYYFLLDNAYWEEELCTTMKAFNRYKDTVFFIGSKAYGKLQEHNIDKIYYVYANKYPYKHIISDMDKNRTICMNVVAGAISSAMYMGFSEIYLLGCDYTAFASQKDDHCYDSDYVPNKKENLAFYLKYYEIATRIHYLLSKMARQNSVSIINLTENSLLDAYPKKRMEDIIVDITINKK